MSAGADQPPAPLEPVKEMAHERGAAAGGGGGGRVSPPPPGVSPSSPPPTAPNQDRTFHHQILQLKKQQQLQQQILLQHFQAQQQQLAEQHEAQLRQHLKQKVMEEQAAAAAAAQQQQQQQQQAAAAAAAAVAARDARERRERDRIDALRKKDRHDHSAIASNEVKQKLQVFLMKKQAAATANGTVPGSPYRNWGVVKSSSGESIMSGINNSHPYKLPHQPVLTKYDSNDFPLRKTASEPNLLKVRLKQRVIERRASPMARRHNRLMKHRSAGKLSHHRTNCDGGSGSPPGARGSPTSGANAPIREEEGEGLHYSITSGQGPPGSSHATDLTLFTSPSMPNISLGRPHVASGVGESSMLATVSEAEVRAAFTARLGMPLTAEGLLPPSLPYYPMIPVEPPTPQPYPAPPITDSQVARARLNKRPLGRTQSAPLPLGHPLLVGGTVEVVPVGQPPPTHPQHHYYLKQQIRQTVLTRAAAGGAARQLDESDEGEVIDLTDKRARAEPPVSLTSVIPPPTTTLSPPQSPENYSQRDVIMKQTLQVCEDTYSRGSVVTGKPLCRAVSSPLVHLGGQIVSPSVSPEHSSSATCLSTNSLSGPPQTGLAYDALMLKHACACGRHAPQHPEHGGRLQSVWARLCETQLAGRCGRPRPRKATLDELRACHTEAHTLLFGTNPLSRQKLDASRLAALPVRSFVRLECGGLGVDSDTAWSELHTAPAARAAAGAVIDLAHKCATGEMKNGFAVVRPPGHHAEAAQAMGFCFFNSVAIAARLLQQRLDLKRILILDWDVHHGNGTQQIFYDDPRVLYISIHRHDDGNFFPGTGGPTECGTGAGLGFNVNIAWSGGLNPPLGDAEYLAAFRTIVIPIAKEFDPQIVLVSCGFDAAVGHPAPLGGYRVSAACFGHMTKELMQVADGKVVLALEGGYDLAAICDSAESCVRALLGDPISAIASNELMRPPAPIAVETLQKTIAIQLPHWPCLRSGAGVSFGPAAGWSAARDDAAETVTAMASLSVQHHHRHHHMTSDRSREDSEEPMEQDEGK